MTQANNCKQITSIRLLSVVYLLTNILYSMEAIILLLYIDTARLRTILDHN